MHRLTTRFIKIKIDILFPVRFANTILSQLPRTCWAVLVQYGKGSPRYGPTNGYLRFQSPPEKFSVEPIGGMVSQVDSRVQLKYGDKVGAKALFP